jgi:hypothetical protein
MSDSEVTGGLKIWSGDSDRLGHKNRRVRAGQYEFTVSPPGRASVVYDIHEVGRSEGEVNSKWLIRRKGREWFEAAHTLREAKEWAVEDAVNNDQ